MITNMTSLPNYNIYKKATPVQFKGLINKPDNELSNTTKTEKKVPNETIKQIALIGIFTVVCIIGFIMNRLLPLYVLKKVID